MMREQRYRRLTPATSSQVAAGAILGSRCPLSEIAALGLGPTHIGEVHPPFAVLADSSVLFAPLARPEGLAREQELAPYARFLAHLACATRDHDIVALYDWLMTSSAVGWPGARNLAGDPVLEPLAGDVATPGLDMPMGKVGWRRGGFNPFLQGDEAG